MIIDEYRMDLPLYRLVRLNIGFTEELKVGFLKSDIYKYYIQQKSMRPRETKLTEPISRDILKSKFNLYILAPPLKYLERFNLGLKNHIEERKEEYEQRGFSVIVKNIKLGPIYSLNKTVPNINKETVLQNKSHVYASYIGNKVIRYLRDRRLEYIRQVPNILHAINTGISDAGLYASKDDPMKKIKIQLTSKIPQSDENESSS